MTAGSSGRTRGRAEPGAGLVVGAARASRSMPTFVLYPLSQTVRYSFYDWDGFGPATWVGMDNYEPVLDRRAAAAAPCCTRWC